MSVTNDLVELRDWLKGRAVTSRGAAFRYAQCAGNPSHMARNLHHDADRLARWADAVDEAISVGVRDDG